MKIIYHLLVWLFVFMTFHLSGQQIYDAIAGDTVILRLLNNPDGELRWQEKDDSLSLWNDIPGSYTDTAHYLIGANNSGFKYFRAILTHTNQYFFPAFNKMVMPNPPPYGGWMIFLTSVQNYTAVQWQQKTDSLSPWTDIPGATSNTYQFVTHDPAVLSYEFRLRVNNPLYLCKSYSFPLTIRICNDISGFLSGHYYGGGLIFYTDTANGTGLAAAPRDQGASVWGCTGTSIPGASGSAIGTGAQNTAAIVSGCTSQGIAAYVCDTLNLNSYNDWFLPSIGELELLYSKLHGNSLSGYYSGSDYWTSTETSANDAYAYSFAASWYWPTNKGTGWNRVAPIRSFDVSVPQKITTVLMPNSVVANISVQFLPNNLNSVIANYTEEVESGATLNWDFAGGTVISGSGKGPYLIMYNDAAVRQITLYITSGTCTSPTYSSNEFRLPLFENTNPAFPAVTTGASEWFDYNNDGYLDAIITGSDTTRLYRNDAGAGFSAVPYSFPSLSYSNLAIGDYNNDGLPDILLFGKTDSVNITRLYKNEGNESFSQDSSEFPGVLYGSAKFIDYNNDGFPDILLSGEDNNGDPLTRLYKNNKTTPFTEVQSGIINLKNSAIAVCDYNHDQFSDFIITGNNGPTRYSRIYKNTRGAFTDIGAPVSAVNSGGVDWGDFNNDGNPDFVISGMNCNPTSWSSNCLTYINSATLQIFQNNGNDSFSMATARSGYMAYARSSLKNGDYDNDGDLDFAITGVVGVGECTVGIGGGADSLLEFLSSAPRVYRNDGNYALTDIQVNIPRCETAPNEFCVDAYFSSFSISWGDFNNDGKLDILRTANGDDGDYTSIYRNGMNSGNTPPCAPSGLHTVVIGDTIMFSWHRATDPETPQPGLSYNLRIGTTCGGNDILSSNSDTSGRRKLASMGNAFQDTCWRLHGLPPGTYYWSVQAIDNGFAGSSFSVADSFMIFPGTRISGIVKYNNPQNSPIDSSWICRYYGGLRNDSCMTDLTGSFYFPNCQQGYNVMNVNTSKPWGGVNGTDALEILRHFTGLEPITEPVKLQAADVNNNDAINGTDALKVKRRFVGLDSGFDRGDWTFAKPTSGGDSIYCGGSDVVQDFYALCVGDVNASYLPPAGMKNHQGVLLSYEDTISVYPGQIFELPVISKRELSFSALSIVLKFPPEQLHVLDVTMNKPGLLFNIAGDQLRMVWSEISPSVLQPGEELIKITLRAADNLSENSMIRIGMTDVSEMAEAECKIIDLVTLKSSLIKGAATAGLGDDPGQVTLKVLPNPNKGEFLVQAYPAINQTFTLTLTECKGMQVKVLHGIRLRNGTSELLNFNGLRPGVYLLSLKNGSTEITGKVFIN